MNKTIVIDVFIFAIEAAATLAFAVSGLLEAARKRLDPVGVCMVSGLAAFGGGTLRDILLDRRPFFWVEHAIWLWVLLAICIIAMAWMKKSHVVLTHRAMQWPDALGLGLFSASGTEIALAQGLPSIVSVLMGVITASFGGVLRDIVCNEIPSAFRDHQPYAICAFAGAWMIVASHSLGMTSEMGLVIGAFTAFGLRALALATGFQLPKWTVVEDDK